MNRFSSNSNPICKRQLQQHQLLIIKQKGGYTSSFANNNTEKIINNKNVEKPKPIPKVEVPKVEIPKVEVPKPIIKPIEIPKPIEIEKPVISMNNDIDKIISKNRKRNK